MLTRKEFLFIFVVVVAFAAAALAVSWASSFGIDIAWFDGASTLGRCIGSTCTWAG